MNISWPSQWLTPLRSVLLACALLLVLAVSLIQLPSRVTAAPSAVQSVQIASCAPSDPPPTPTPSPKPKPKPRPRPKSYLFA